MEKNDYRCLTCYQQLTKEEYEEHKRKGHVTLEYVIQEQKRKQDDKKRA